MVVAIEVVIGEVKEAAAIVGATGEALIAAANEAVVIEIGAVTEGVIGVAPAAAIVGVSEHLNVLPSEIAKEAVNEVASAAAAIVIADMSRDRGPERERGSSERGSSDRGGSERSSSDRGGSERGNSERGGSDRGSDRGSSDRGAGRGPERGPPRGRRDDRGDRR